MCGVCGGFRMSGAPPVEPRELKRMTAALKHRGPDESGLVTAPEGGLGNARLAILDLEHGRQPLANETNDVWTVLNGEIFNHVELRQNLEVRGHRFRTRTDTEVLAHLYEEAGDDLVHDLNGQFALAILDRRRGRLLLARDRLGIAPLFYTVERDRLWFASELKALLSLPGIRGDPDPLGFQQVFTFWTTLPPRTLFRNLLSLPPAHTLTADRDGFRVRRYWRLTFPRATETTSPSSRAIDALAEELRARLDASVTLRLRADVPVAVFLSGGLDSSLISALARRRNESLASFSVRFEDPALDEGPHQHAVARFLGTRHHETFCGSADILRDLPAVVWHAEQPLVRTAPAPLYALARLVHAHGFKVVLSGEGSDELFGGYDLFQEMRLRRFWARQPDSRLRPRLLQRLYPGQPDWPRRMPAHLEGFYRRHLEETASPVYSHLHRWETTAWIRRFFSPEWRALWDHADPVEELKSGLPPDFSTWEPLAQAQFLEIETLLSGHLLSAQGDRMVMAHGVESRPPFLDHRLVEWSAALPTAFKIQGLREKVGLKRAAESLVPASIIHRHKQAYRAPDAAGLLADNRLPAFAEDLLTREQVARTGYFDADAVTALTAKCRSGASWGNREQWAMTGILTTLLWHDQFIAAKYAAPDQAATVSSRTGGAS